MKRQLEGASESQDSSRRAKVRRRVDSRGREDDELVTGELDLNATPRGFDLNAPVAEEEGSQEHGTWQDKSLVCRELPSETGQTELEDPVHLEASEQVSSGKLCQTGQEDEDTEKTIGSTVSEADKAEVNEDPQQGSAPPSRPHVSIPIPLETPSGLGIDDDLDIIRSAWSALQESNMLALDTVLVDACEELAKSSQNLSKYHLLSCLYISKRFPEAFRLPKTCQMLLSYFSCGKAQPAPKRQNLLPSLACRLLNRAFASESEWPMDFVKHYLEDAIGGRTWIENDGCKEFVSNVLSAFPDPVADGNGGLEDIRQDLQGPADLGHGLASQGPVRNRYPGDEARQQVRTEFLNALFQLLATNATKENPRVLLRLLVQGAGYEEVRVLGSSMLESWLNNPVHVRSAKGLLDRIVKHTHATSENDFNTVANLLALRVTSPQVPGQMKSLHGNIFTDMVSQLVRRRPEYATLALKTFVTAEINNKNPHNVKSIATVLKAMTDCLPPEQELALILQELAVSEDSRPHLKDLVRRIMKQAGPDINVHALCHGLMQPWPAMEEQHDPVKEAWLKQIVDLVCQLLLHAVAQYATDEGLVTAILSSPPALGSGTYPSGAGCVLLKEKLSVMEKFSIETANLQEDAMAWCTDVLAVYLPRFQETKFLQTVRQLLFLEGPEAYSISSENFGDLDMLCYKLLTSCLRAPEEILARLILMGISSYPLSQADAMDVIEGLVWRAVKLQNHMDGVLTAKSDQLPAAIFKLASVNLSANTRLQFVLKDLYWRAAMVVLTIAVCNPMTIGQFVWSNCPSIRFIMEFILTRRTPVFGLGVNKFEADKLELDAIQRDIKAEEAISAFYAAQAASDVVTPVPWPFQGEELRGNVMVLNQGGPPRQPPVGVLDELKHIDEACQLGSMLRKCKTPNFFSEVTSSQTLQQAWTWLENVIISDPGVMTVLPCLWQCELLYMYEVSTVTSERQVLDLSGVRSNLHKIITQGTQSGGVDDVNIVIGFLARKLASRNSRSRHCARLCFTRLVTGESSPAVADFAGSASEKGGSASELFDPDNCEWLEIVAEGATKSQVIEVLAPALQLAIQMESNVHVVSAYLDFLQKHLVSLPSTGCLTCCISCLVVQRKYLCACLFSENSMAAGSMEIRYSSVSNFVLQTVLGALQLGSAFDHGWSKFVVHDVPIVTLVSPKSAASAVLRVEVHKMVVDAAIQLVAWSANSSLDVAKQAMYEKLLEFLLPGYVHCKTRTSHDNPPISWLEAPGGQMFPLLSQGQATSFARCKDPRVFTAGFSVLSIETKLDLLAGLGLSTLAGSALLEEFDEIPETRLRDALSLKGITTHRVKRIENSLILLQKSGSKGGASFLAKLRSCSSDLLSYSMVCAQSNEKQDDVLCSSDVPASTKFMKDMREFEVLSPLEGLHGNCSSSQPLRSHASELLSGPDVATKKSDPAEHRKRQRLFMRSKYVQFRKMFAKCVLEVNHRDFNKCLEFMMESLTRNKSIGATATSSSALSLPISWFLWHCGSVPIPTPNGCETRVEESDIPVLRASFLAILSLLRSWLHEAPGDKSIEGLCLARATSIVQELGDMSNKDCQGQGSRCIYSKVRAQLSVTNCTPGFGLLEDRPVQEFEAELLANLSLAYALPGTADHLGESMSNDTGQSTDSLVIRELVTLLSNWQDSSIDCGLHNSEDYILAQRKQVELSGRIGLTAEVLLILDPELRSDHHRQAVSGVQASSLTTGRELETPSHAKLGLECVLHRASWKAVSQVIAAIFGTQGNHPVSHEQDVEDKGDGQLSGSGVSMEFLASCMQHPHARLACRISNESNLKDIRFNLVTSFFQLASVNMLVRLCVLESSAVRLSMHTNICGGSGHNLRLLSRHNRVLKLIMFVASEGPELMSNVVQQLLHLQKGNGQEILATLRSIPMGRDKMRESIKLAASDILWALYGAFPVSVMQVCGYLDEKEFMEAIPRSLASCAEQVSCLSQVLHKTMGLIFGGSERESNAAYDFLHAFGRQHPSLVIPHLPMLALHLQNLLPAVKQGDNQSRSTLPRTLCMVIELLDALRPYVLEQNNVTWESADKGGCNQASKCHVEAILAMYLDFLQDLDRPQFAKVVPRVADFLCHCVAMGGRCRQFVMSYHKPVLQTAAQTFGKIKKLGYLLTLLENASFTGIAEEPPIQHHPLKSGNMGAVTGPSSLPMDDVLKVRKQLLQYLRWQTPDKWADADFSGSGKDRCYSPRHVHGLYMEEVEDVNLGAALSDLETASARMPTLLPLLEDSLLELSKVSDSNIRDKAYSLLQRQLLHCPSKQTATKLVRGLLEQLASSDLSLAKCAARHVSPFFHCCPDYQEAVLVEMLKLGRAGADDLLQLVQGLFAISGGT